MRGLWKSHGLNRPLSSFLYALASQQNTSVMVIRKGAQRCHSPLKKAFKITSEFEAFCGALKFCMAENQAPDPGSNLGGYGLGKDGRKEDIYGRKDKSSDL